LQFARYLKTHRQRRIIVKRTLLLFLLLAVVAAGAVFVHFNSNSDVKFFGSTVVDNAANYVAYHNKHKDLEIMVNNFRQAHPNNWVFLQLGLMANEKVIITTKTVSQGFIAHYMIREQNEPLYELLCFADDDIPASPRQNGAQGDPPKVGLAKRGFYQEVCNQKAEKVMQFIREKEKL